MTYLGLDLGTSGLRALLVDQGGGVIGSAARDYTVSHPQPGWSEQDPAQWTDALHACVAALRRAHPEFGDLGGIGVSGHMHGATLVDDSGRVLRPCILWNDSRATREAAHLDALPEVREISGNIVFPGFTAPKLLWVERHEPEVFAQIHKVLLPAAYLNFYLTGQHVADMSDSAGTAWFDLRRRDWSDALLDAGHMSRDQMPALVEGCEKAGALRADLARQWGLKRPVTIAGGAGDNAAAACGAGVVRAGQGSVSLGTSGVFLAARDGCAPAPETAVHTFCHAVPDRWYQMGVMLAAADSLTWFSRITGASAPALTSELGEALQPPGPLRFLPYLAGERTPHNDSGMRGAFTGIGAGTSRQDMTRAILEGVCYGLRDAQLALRQGGADPDRIIALGGGSNSDYWLRLLATVLELPVARPRDGDFGAALGAARLAILADTQANPDDILVAAEIGEIFEPDPALTPRFHAEHARFKASYPAIRAVQ